MSLTRPRKKKKKPKTSPPRPVEEEIRGPRSALFLTASRRLTRLLIPSDQSHHWAGSGASKGNPGHELDLELAPPSTGVPASPLERFWDETHRHERIAYMMQQLERRSAAAAASEAAVPPPAPPLPGCAARTQPTSPTGLKQLASVRESDEDRRMPAAGQCERSPSPSPRFRPGLEIDAELVVDDEDASGEVFDLEAIKIATRMK